MKLSKVTILGLVRASSLLQRSLASPLPMDHLGKYISNAFHRIPTPNPFNSFANPQFEAAPVPADTLEDSDLRARPRHARSGSINHALTLEGWHPYQNINSIPPTANRNLQAYPNPTNSEPQQLHHGLDHDVLNRLPFHYPDHYIHLGQEQSMHLAQSRASQYEQGEGSSRSQADNYHHQYPVEEQGPVNYHRPYRLRQYSWQLEISENQVLQIYRTVASRWNPANKATTHANLERLNAYLEQYQDSVQQILDNDNDAIFKAVRISRPTYAKEKKLKKAKMDAKLETVDGLLNWVQVTPCDRSSPDSMRPSWAPKRLDSKKQHFLVEMLHRVWIKDRQSVKKVLGRMGDAMVDEWLDRLLDPNKKKRYEAAEQLDRFWSGKRRKNVADSQRKRHSKGSTSTYPQLGYLQQPYHGDSHGGLPLSLYHQGPSFVIPQVPPHPIEQQPYGGKDWNLDS